MPLGPGAGKKRKLGVLASATRREFELPSAGRPGRRGVAGEDSGRTGLASFPSQYVECSANE